MSKIIFCDTETTGLPETRGYRNYYSYTDIEKYKKCRIVQFSWMVCELNGEVFDKKNFIVKPSGFEIPLESTKIHGITNERAIQDGNSIEDVMESFYESLKKCVMIVCHNTMFDLNVIKSEAHRLNKQHIIDEINHTDEICTMLLGTDICKLPSKFPGSYKFPKLSELHMHLFQTEMKGLHDACVDTECTAKCFFKIIQ